MFRGKIHYKWSFSVAMSNHQRVSSRVNIPSDKQPQFLWKDPPSFIQVTLDNSTINEPFSIANRQFTRGYQQMKQMWKAQWNFLDDLRMVGGSIMKIDIFLESPVLQVPSGKVFRHSKKHKAKHIAGGVWNCLERYGVQPQPLYYFCLRVELGKSQLWYFPAWGYPAQHMNVSRQNMVDRLQFDVLSLQEAKTIFHAEWLMLVGKAMRFGTFGVSELPLHLKMIAVKLQNQILGR